VCFIIYLEIYLRFYVITSVNVKDFILWVRMPPTASIFRIDVVQGYMNFPKTKIKRRILGVREVT